MSSKKSIILISLEEGRGGYYFIKGINVINGIINHQVTSNINEATYYSDDDVKQALKVAKTDFTSSNGYKLKAVKLF